MAIVRAKRPDTHEVALKLSADEGVSLAPGVGLSRSGPYRKERPDRSAYTPTTDSGVGGDGLATQSAQINHRHEIQVTSPGFGYESIRRQT